MNKYYLIIILLIGVSSCYNYNGPTRPKREIPPVKVRTLKVKPNITSRDYLNQMAEAIKKALPSAQVSIVEDSIKVLFPDNILYGKSAVLPKDDINREINKLAKLIVKFDQTNVLVTGHTDKSGDDAQNKKLSSLRASYIVDLLTAYKAPKNRMNSWGLGSSSPIASEQTEEGVEKNRRVEFVILSTIVDDEEL